MGCRVNSQLINELTVELIINSVVMMVTEQKDVLENSTSIKTLTHKLGLSLQGVVH